MTTKTGAGSRPATGWHEGPSPADGLPAQWSPPLAGHRPLPAVMILVADPDRETRELLADGLTQSGVGQVIVAGSLAAVEEIISRHVAGELALVSLAYGAASGRVIHGLRRAPWQHVLALAPTSNSDVLLGAIYAGACGVLRGHPRTPAAELPRQVHELSERETEVLRHVADGRSNKWIGEELALSALTVKSHLARISRKLGTGDRSHMVAIALRAGAIR